MSSDRIFNVLDYGATGNGSQDATDTTGTAAACAALAVAGGGVLYFPAGSYWLLNELAFVAGSKGHEIILRGAGMDSTILNFVGAAAGAHGITFTAGSSFGVEDLTILNARGVGLWVGKGSVPGTPPFADMFLIRNVKVQYSLSDGMRFTNAFMGTLSDSWVRSNGGRGIRFDGYHTSMFVTRTWAQFSVGANWSLNGLTYSTFAACGADSSTGGPGWEVSNVAAVTIAECGAEANAQDAFLLTTSDASATGMPYAAQDINGLTINNCFAFYNSASSPGGYASFVAARTADNRAIDARVISGVVTPNGASDVAFVLNANAGTVTLTQDGVRLFGATAPDVTNGSLVRVNRSAAGKSCTLLLASAYAAIDGATNPVPFSVAAVNDLQSTTNGTGVVIPRGVNKVRVSVNVAFAGNAVGVRQLYVRKNGAPAPGLPQVAINAALAISGTFLSATSSVIPVALGDVLSVDAYQNSGASLPILANNATWLTVEAVN